MPGKKASKKAAKKSPKPTSTEAWQQLEQRVVLLEQQVKYLMTKTAATDIQLAQGEEITDLRTLEEIKTLVKNNLLPGQSKTVDDIMNLPQLRKYKGSMIEKAINMLIDDEVLDGTEGKSALFEINICPFSFFS